jgi:hypothetical protein
MDNKLEILWRMYNEHVTMGRHHEIQRSTMSQIILAVAGALVGFFGSTGASSQNRWAVAIFIVILGVFGALFSAKQYERSKFHMSAAGLHRVELEKLAGVNLSKIRGDAEDKQKKDFPITEAWSLNKFWTGIHALIAVFGAILLVQALLA